VARDPFATPAERTAQAMAKMTPGTLRGASRIATPGRAPGRPKRIPATAPLPSGWVFTTSGPVASADGPRSSQWTSDTTADALGITVTATHFGDVPVEFYFACDYACNYDVLVGEAVTIPPGVGPQTISRAYPTGGDSGAVVTILPGRFYFFYASGLALGPPETYLSDVSATVTLLGDHPDIHVGWTPPT